MSGRWVHRDARTGAVLVINTDIFSDVLFDAGAPAVDALAREGAAIARRAAEGSDKRFIINRPAKRFALESGEIRSSLSRKLSIPVALIANNSLFAVKREVGSTNRAPTRPLGRAFNELRRKRGVRGVVPGADIVGLARPVPRKRGKR
jgi:hypothetical protein